MGKNLITLLFAFTLIASASWELDFDEDFASASTGTPDVLDGLVAWWKMDEASWNGTAGEVVDSSGVYNAVSIGGAQTTNGIINRAGSFNSALSQRVETPFTSELADFTASVWFKSEGLGGFGYDRIIDKGYLTGFCINRDNSSLATWRAYILGTALGNITLSESNWHNIVLVRSGTLATLYGDGGSVSSSGTVSSNALSTININIAFSRPMDDGNPFHGLIDDVRIYNRALSSNEVYQIYNKYK